MQKAILAGVFVFVSVFAATSPKTGATSSIDLAVNSTSSALDEIVAVASNDDATPGVAQPEAKEVHAPEPTKHTVQKGESLSKIATQHNTTWKRLFDKNTSIENPDVIEIGQKIVVPLADEQLETRELPAPPPPPQPTARTQPSGSRSAPVQSVSYPKGSSAGNLYADGNCTWYVKSMRPDLPNNLGNADTWAARAAAQGIPTGSTPRVGAAAQSRRGMHVVYVTGVNSDGTINLSEMNRRRLGEITTRTAPASDFIYIY